MLLASGLLADVALLSVVPSLPANAQITPDGTLGRDRSEVTRDAIIRGERGDRIDGGALRGTNLFHSFSEFNVNNGQRVYFANPAGIETIFSRVTGTDVSDILGTLGVDGNADLFFLNPNGIIFGPDAQLDIAGSFVASTGSAFTFADGSSFSAVDPQAPPLLTVSVPVGIQYGGDGVNPAAPGLLPGAIANAGSLTVGQNLRLAAGSVNSTGSLTVGGDLRVEGVTGDVAIRNATAQTATLSAQGNLLLREGRLQTTGDLNLLAADTVQVRDSVTNPFLALAGGNLTIQGDRSIDILALNHPDPAFQSAGNLTLASDGTISGDAHYWSGGDVSIVNLAGQPGNFASLYDPIISANGDVLLGGYTGTALKIEAIGNITIEGDVSITGPDTTLSPSATLGNFQILDTGMNFSGTLSNGFGSVAASELERFLGLAPEALNGDPFNNGIATEGSGFTTQIQANANDQITFDWLYNTSEGFDSLYNDFALASLINTVTGERIDAGTVELSDTTGIPTGTYSFVIPTTGSYRLGVGVADVTDDQFDTTIQISNVRVNNVNLNITPSNDPDIPTLRSSPALILRAGVTTLLNSPGDGGVIPPPTVTPLPNPDPSASVTVTGNISTASTTLSGGPVDISAPGAITITGNIDSFSTVGTGGALTLTAGDAIAFTGDINSSSSAGNGGAIAFSAGTTLSVNGNLNSTSSAVNGGDVNLVAGGNLTFGDRPINVNPSIYSGGINTSSSAAAGQGGVIRLQSLNGNLTVSSQDPLLQSRIVFDASSANGSGGNLDILADNGQITLSALRALTEANGAGSAGNIVVRGDTIALDRVTLSAPIRGNSPFQGLDPQIFLFDALGTFLDGNDDEFNLLAGGGGSSSIRDSYLEYDFITGGTYFLGVGAFPSNPFSGNPDAPLAGTPLSTGTYTLNLSVEGNVATTVDRAVLTPEAETNDSLSGAQAIAPSDFILSRSNSPNQNVEASTTIPYVSIAGTGDGTFDYYRFTVSDSPGVTLRGIFDIDTATAGQAGQISLIADTGDIRLSQSQLDASTFGNGAGGNIVVNSVGDVTLSNASSLRTTVGQNATGIGGDIIVTAPRLAMSGGSSFNAGNDGLGRGGEIRVNASQSVALDGSSSIRTTVSETGQGNGGDIFVVTPDLAVRGGSRLEAQTLGSNGFQLGREARAGNIFINTGTGVAEDAGEAAVVTISGASPSGFVSGIFTSTENQNSGLGGNITINADALTVANRAVLSALTRNASNSGSIAVNVNTLAVTNGGQLITSSLQGPGQAGGQAGEIRVNARDAITISGTASPIVRPTSPFNAITLTQIPAFATCNPAGCEPFVESANEIPFYTTGAVPVSGDNTFRYYSFSVRTAGGIGIFDIDQAYKEDGTGAQTVDSVETHIFLFNQDTGEVLAQNDFAPTDPGSTPLSFYPEFSYDTAIRYDFSSPGRYVLGVGRYFTQAGNVGAGDAPLVGSTIAPNQTYRLNVSVQGAGSLEGLNPNLPNSDGTYSSGLFAQATGLANSGAVRLTTPRLTVADGGQVSASTVAGVGSDVVLQNVRALTVRNGEISASTETGTAGSLQLNQGQAAAGQVTITGVRSQTDTTGIQRGGLFAEATGAGGSAGSVLLNAANVVVEDGAQISASNVSSQTGGDINLTNVDSLRLTNGQISASTQTGQAGNLRLNIGAGQRPADSLTVEGARGGIFARAQGAGGSAGDVLLNVEDVTVWRGGEISASNVSGSRRSNVRFTSVDRLQLSNGEISASTQTGQAGDVTVNRLSGAAESIELSNGGRILTEGTGAGGTAGDILLNAQQIAVQSQSLISAANQSGQTASNIDLINVQRLEVVNGEISASTATGQAGSVTINQGQGQEAADAVVLSNGGRILTQGTGAGGTAGDILLNAQQIAVQSQSLISAANQSGQTASNIALTNVQRLEVVNGEISASTETGRAGSVTINQGQDAAEAVVLSGVRSPANSSEVVRGGLFAEATGNNGLAGGVTINARDITVQENAQVSTTNVSSQTASSITLTNVDTLRVLNGEISASTQSGQAGSVTINQGQPRAELVFLSGRRSNDNGGLLAQAEESGGSAGNVEVNAGRIAVRDGAEISTSNRNSAAGGDIRLSGVDRLVVSNGQVSTSTVTGQAGSLSVNLGQGPADSVIVGGRQGALFARARGAGGTAGDVTINARGITVRDNAQISTANVSGATGGSVVLTNVDVLNVFNGEISTSTETGIAGDLTVNVPGEAADAVVLRGVRSPSSTRSQATSAASDTLSQGGLFARATRAGGTAGDVVVNARQVTVADGAEISASNVSGDTGGNIRLFGLDRLEVLNGQIAASTRSGQGGSVSILAPGGAVQVLNGQIAASTRNGQGGSVSILAPGGAVRVQGDRAALSVEATNGGTAGSLDVSTANLNVEDGAGITVSSDGGQAGTLNLRTVFTVLNRGRLQARSGAGTDGGNINLVATGQVLALSNQSEISAEASGSANGGNVDIQVPNGFVLSGAYENSDILANAVLGNGGNIDIEALAIFGLEERPERTALSDIVASSQFGSSGTIALTTLGIDPSRGLTDLSTDVVDASTQIAASCRPQEGSGDVGEFIVTGRGGLPPNPLEPLSTSTPLADLVTLPADAPVGGVTSVQQTSQQAIPEIIATVIRPADAPLIEAQGWVIGANGEVILTAQAPTATPQNGAFGASQCAAQS